MNYYSFSCKGCGTNTHLLALLHVYCTDFLHAVQCHGPPETGKCFAYKRRWAFISATQSCEPFVYGGCGGNDNNHKTEKMCMARCVHKNVQKNMTHLMIRLPAQASPFLHELESYLEALHTLEGNITGRDDLRWTTAAFRKAARMLFRTQEGMVSNCDASNELMH